MTDIQQKKYGRKYALLLGLTAAAIGGLLGYGQWQSGAVAAVQTTVLTRRTVRETAVCSGKIQASNSVEVYSSMPCVAGEVAVAVGDRVKEGTPLVKVDRTATLAVAASAGLGENQAALASKLPDALTAPRDGVVSAVNVKKGDKMDTASPSAVIAASDGLQVAVTVKENALSRLHIGQTVEVSGVAFQKKSYGGTLSSIASSARTRLNGTTSETVVDAVVTLTPEDIDDSLLVGLNAKAEIVISQKEGVLLIPYEYLGQEEDGSYYVYCLRGAQAVYTPVKTGADYAGGAEVISGLSEGDELVRSPETLSGDRVRVRSTTEINGA